MAVIDKEKQNKPFLVDRDETLFVGIDLPFRIGQRGEGWGASSQTTLEAVKNNLRNLVSTEQGERLYHPSLGLPLRKYLFEPITPDTLDTIRSSIVESVNFWLPFVLINNIDINLSDNQAGNFRNLLVISISFSLKVDPTNLESITINIGE